MNFTSSLKQKLSQDFRNQRARVGNPLQILANQLTLFRPGGADYAHHIARFPPPPPPDFKLFTALSSQTEALKSQQMMV